MILNPRSLRLMRWPPGGRSFPESFDRESPIAIRLSGILHSCEPSEPLMSESETPEMKLWNARAADARARYLDCLNSKKDDAAALIALAEYIRALRTYVEVAIFGDFR